MSLNSSLYSSIVPLELFFKNWHCFNHFPVLWHWVSFLHTTVCSLAISHSSCLRTLGQKPSVPADLLLLTSSPWSITFSANISVWDKASDTYSEEKGPCFHISNSSIINMDWKKKKISVITFVYLGHSFCISLVLLSLQILWKDSSFCCIRKNM